MFAPTKMTHSKRSWGEGKHWTNILHKKAFVNTRDSRFECNGSSDGKLQLGTLLFFEAAMGRNTLFFCTPRNYAQGPKILFRGNSEWMRSANTDLQNRRWADPMQDFVEKTCNEQKAKDAAKPKRNRPEIWWTYFYLAIDTPCALRERLRMLQISFSCARGTRKVR